jgi:hypothetical protein
MAFFHGIIIPQIHAEAHVNACIDNTTTITTTTTKTFAFSSSTSQRQSTLFGTLKKTEPISTEPRLPRLSPGGVVPAQKRILGTPYVVDAFKAPVEGCEFYFLRYTNEGHGLI